MEEKRLCPAFARGSCSLGEACGWSHVTPAAAANNAAPAAAGVPSSAAAPAATAASSSDAEAARLHNRAANRAAIAQMRAEEEAARQGRSQKGKKGKKSSSNIDAELARAADVLRAKSKAGDFDGVRGVLKATQKEWGKRAIATIINGGDAQGRTALYWASFKGAHTIVDGLVRMGAKVDLQLPGDGSTAAHIAAFNGHVDALRSICKAGGNVALDIPRKNGWTPLFEAVEHNHGDAVTFLLESGVDPSAATPNGRTACFVAAQESNVAMIELMLEAVAANAAALALVAAALAGSGEDDAVDVNVDAAAAAGAGAGAGANAPDGEGSEALAAAADAGGTAAAAAAAPAAAAGAGAVADPNRSTADAVAAAQLRMVSTIDHHGFSPLFAAVAWGESKALHVLVSAGAKVCMPPPAEVEPRAVAVQRWVIPVVELSNDQKTAELNLLRQAKLPFAAVAAAAAEETRLTPAGKVVLQGYAMMDGPPPQA